MRIRSFLPIVVASGVVLGTASFAQADERSTTIALGSTTIDVSQPAPKVASELSVAASRAVTQDGAAAEDYLLVKLPGPVSAAQRQALERSAERVYAYLPYDTFLVKRRHGESFLKAEVGARWTGAYEPAYKLSPSLEAAAGYHDGRPAIVMVHVYPDAPLDEVVAEIERLGLGKVVGAQEKERFSRIRLLVEPVHAAAAGVELARIAEVSWIGAEPRRTLLNDTTVWVAQSGTNGGQATPVHDQGILGEGQIVGVLDTGIDPDMCYFRDGSLGLPPVNACNGGTTVDLNQRKVVAVDFLWSSECSGGISSGEWDTHDHGSHVAGTIAGDDLANPLVHDAGDGLAPGAKLVVQDCGFQTNNCADCPGIGCPVVDLNPVFQQPYDQGARIHSNSWGDDENNPNGGLYSSGSEDSDEFMWNHKDFVLVYANGNSGPGSVTVLSPATGKNVVSVGATLRGSSAESMASFSSCGPTADGRIKPDVTMPGSSIVSANNDGSTGTNNCGTRTMSGTSMAAPGAAGSLALIREYFMDGFYPSGAENAPDAFTPSGALLKATVINSGRDMTNVAAIPSNCQGWGRVTLGDALYFTGDSRHLWVEDDTTGFAQGSSGETRSFNFSVSTSSVPFKATLTWTDYPATPGANPTIVNDLDLEVVGPGGTYLGNVFSGGQSTTGGSADRLDTVEQVLIKNPAVGDYTVTVRSFTVPNGPQPFALVVTGDLNGCSPAPIADAGNDRTIFEGQSTTIGTPAQPGHTYSWSPGGATTAEVSVSPTTTTTYTVTATTSCGSAQDSVTVTVVPPGGCLHDVDFESGAGGWTNGADTCTTGSFVVGSPDATDWQVAGGNPGNAYYTQPNPGGVGTDDVDGGTCEALSPQVDASSASAVDITFDYFHGQRDAGDDPADGFTVEVLNDGVVVDTVVAIGDVTHAAAWTAASTTVTNPGTIRIRVRATDAASTGDIVEGGIDNVRICSSGPECSVDADCDDGLFCNGAETCNAGTCQAGSDPCPGQSCDETNDVCVAGGCTVDDDFESGTAGWTNDAASTCSTGAYVEGNPTNPSGGYQIVGSHSGVTSIFTAVNSSAGVDDVDGGNCILASPSWAVANASTLSVWYWHGQRDAGDDPSGDFFYLEVSTNGGSTWNTLASNGDTTSNPTWLNATASIPAGSDVKLRVQCSDGSAGGDLVECGIDDVSICSQ